MLARLILGSTLNYVTTVAGYSASDGWVLKFRLIPRASGSAISITCIADTADPSAHRAQVSAGTTATWTAGIYSWASWVELGSEKYDVATGVITLVADPRTASAPYDLRSDAQVALDNVRATIRGKASADVLRYQIAGRSLERYAMSELIALESKLATEVAREIEAARLAAGLKSRKQIYVRTGRV